MSLLIPIIIGTTIGLIGGIIIAILERKKTLQNEYAYFDDYEEEDDENNWDDSINYNLWNNNKLSKQKQSDYDPFDNHWESSFDWQDKDNDGYDDRDDGFWNEREF